MTCFVDFSLVGKVGPSPRHSLDPPRFMQSGDGFQHVRIERIPDDAASRLVDHDRGEIVEEAPIGIPVTPLFRPGSNPE